MLIVNATLLTLGTEPQVKPNAALYIDGDRIGAIGSPR